jgi:hypothetical protein
MQHEADDALERVESLGDPGSAVDADLVLEGVDVLRDHVGQDVGVP